jgi:flagellar basal-body rod modification protein FlgD
VAVKTEISGRVDSVDMAGDDPVLVLGGIRVPLPNVKAISRPAAS